MSATANERTRQRAVAPPTIREHKIPAEDSKPYIAIEGRRRRAVVLRKRRLEDRPASIRRLHASPNSSCRRRTRCRSASSPAATAILWFCARRRNKIGRITLQGDITLVRRCRRRTPGRTACCSAPTAMSGSPKPKSARSAASRRTARSPNSRTASRRARSRCRSSERDGALWFSEAAGNRVGRITMDGKVTEFPIPSHDSQPRAMTTHPDGSIWFVETSTNALGRIDRDGNITEHKVTTPNVFAARRLRRRRRRSLVHRELRQQDRPHGAGRHHGRRISDIPTPGSRRALHRADVERPIVSSRNGMPG